MKLTGDLELQSIEEIDYVAGSSASGDIDVTITHIDNVNKYFYSYFSAGGDVSYSTVYIYRYDFDMNFIDFWESPIEYTILYRSQSRPSLDEDNLSFTTVLRVDNSETGKTSGTGYTAEVCQIDLDLDDISNSTINVIADYRNNPAIQDDLRVINVFYHDKKNKILYMHKGQAGVSNDTYYIKTDYATPGNSSEVSLLEDGAVKAFDFDPFTNTAYSFQLSFEVTERYRLEFNAFNFNTATHSHIASGFIPNLSELSIRVVGDKIITIRHPRLLDPNLEDKLNSLYYEVYDFDLNRLEQVIITDNTRLVGTRLIPQFINNNSTFLTKGGTSYRAITKYSLSQGVKNSNILPSGKEVSSVFYRNLFNDGVFQPSSPNEPFTHIDELNGYAYVVDNAGQTTTSSTPVILYRYDLDTFDYIDSWTSPTGYGGTFREDRIYLDEDKSSFIVPMSIDNSITGLSTSPTYTVGFCEILLNFNDLSLSDINYIAPLRGDENRTAETRITNVLYRDKSENKLYYHIGQFNVNNQSVYFLTDMNNDTTIRATSSTLEGHVLSSDFDKHNLVSRIMLTRFNATDRYFNQYEEFDFKGMTVSKLSTNRIYNRQRISMRMVGDKLIQSRYCTTLDPGGTFSTDAENDLNYFYYEVRDKDLNLIESIKGDVFMNTVGSQESVLLNDSANLIYSRTGTSLRDYNISAITQKEDRTDTFAINSDFSVIDVRDFHADNVEYDRDLKISKIYDNSIGMNLIQYDKSLQSNIIESSAKYNNQPIVSKLTNPTNSHYNTAFDIGRMFEPDRKHWLLMAFNMTGNSSAFTLFDKSVGSGFTNTLYFQRAGVYGGDSEGRFLIGDSGVNPDAVDIFTASGISNDPELIAINIERGEFVTVYNHLSNTTSDNVINDTLANSYTNQFNRVVNSFGQSTYEFGRIRIIETTNLSYQSELDEVNGRMNDMSTQYGLTWSNIV